MAATTGSGWTDRKFAQFMLAEWRKATGNNDPSKSNMPAPERVTGEDLRMMTLEIEQATGKYQSVDDYMDSFAQGEGYKDAAEMEEQVSGKAGKDKNKGGFNPSTGAGDSPDGGGGGGGGPAGGGGGGPGGGGGGGPSGGGGGGPGGGGGGFGGGGFAGGGPARGPMPLTGFNGGVGNAPVTGYGPVQGGGAPGLDGLNTPIPGIDPSLLDTPGIPGYGGLGSSGGSGSGSGGSGGGVGPGSAGGEYGSQSGALSSEDALRLIREQQAATDEANRKNELRYENIKGRYQDRYDRNLADLAGYGDAERANIERAGDRRRASYDQDLINRGLGNTTVRTSAQRGANEDEDRARGELEDRLTMQRIGLDADLMGDKLAFMERREDVGPDNAQFAALLNQYGASGANSGGAGTGSASGTGTGGGGGSAAGGYTDANGNRVPTGRADGQNGVIAPTPGPGDTVRTVPSGVSPVRGGVYAPRPPSEPEIQSLPEATAEERERALQDKYAAQGKYPSGSSPAGGNYSTSVPGMPTPGSGGGGGFISSELQQHLSNGESMESWRDRYSGVSPMGKVATSTPYGGGTYQGGVAYTPGWGGGPSQAPTGIMADTGRDPRPTQTWEELYGNKRPISNSTGLTYSGQQSPTSLPGYTPVKPTRPTQKPTTTGVRPMRPIIH